MTALKVQNFSFGHIEARVSVLLSFPKGKDNVISKFADGPSDWNDSKEAGHWKFSVQLNFSLVFFLERSSEWDLSAYVDRLKTSFSNFQRWSNVCARPTILCSFFLYVWKSQSQNVCSVYRKLTFCDSSVYKSAAIDDG